MCGLNWIGVAQLGSSHMLCDVFKLMDWALKFGFSPREDFV